jgi:hypothetical protein
MPGQAGAPFDFTLYIAEGTSFVISLPTHLSGSAARDDKGDGAVSIEIRYWVREPQIAQGK